MKSIIYEDGILKVRFKFKSKLKWKKYYNEINSINGTYYHVHGNYFEVKANKRNLKKLLNLDFKIDEVSRDLILKVNKKITENKYIDKEKLNGLRKYQIEGVQFLENRNGVALLADDMGVGKTIQALGYLKIHPEIRPAVILCTATLKLNWKKEINIWLKENSFVCNGKNPEWLEDCGIYIINYDILGKGEEKIYVNKETGKKIKRKYLLNDGWWKYLKEKKPQVIIADECQFLANPKSYSVKAFKKLGKNVPHRIGLSGTPIQDKIKDFFEILNFIDPKTFKSRYKFLQRYCDPKFNGFSKLYNGLSNKEELKTLIQPLMIRRLKSDVLKELPKKQKIILPLNCSSLTEYKNLVDFIKKNKNKFSKLDKRNHISKLRQLAYEAKKKEVFKFISDLMKENKKLVVFTYHKKTMQDLKKEFPKSVSIYGSTPNKKRIEYIEKFQNEKVPIYIGQIIASGVGVTLTAANICVFVEFDFNPSKNEQCEDRIYRFGQKADSILCYYLVADNTYDSKILDIANKKYKNNKFLLDGEESEFFEDSIIDEFYNSL